ncbi:LuxR C-terminal-related transcriptional regulator, partial [Leptospira sp. SA-E8]|uniref:LuxR C-terminal-related transcriptional regulator n=1 Tax=Leptospira sp. SA-E8 TaxID=3422259 RepID=UPI003EB6CB9C
ALFIPGGSQEQVHWFNELQRRSATPANALRTLRAVSQIDVSSLAPHVRCPTLVLHSRGDARVPFEEGRLVAGAIPEAQFVPLESRNHVLLQDEPAFATCMGHIRDFMDRHEPASSGRLRLTPREAELLELLAHGLDNLQIAAHLRLAEKTVRNKVSAVFDKLQVET